MEVIDLIGFFGILGIFLGYYFSRNWPIFAGVIILIVISAIGQAWISVLLYFFWLIVMIEREEKERKGPAK